MKPLVNAEQMREMDRRTIVGGISGFDLMERAATGAADFICQDSPNLSSISILAGIGNNGGDGLALARILDKRGVRAHVFLVGDASRMSAESRRNLELLAQTSVEVTRLDAVSGITAENEVWVDALLGIGLDRELKGIYAHTMTFLQNQARVYALDVPSFVQSDTGAFMGPTYRAHATITFGAPKVGLFLEPTRALRGELEVVDIGIPGDIADDVGHRAYLVEPSDLVRPRRPADFHKGRAGRVLIIGGSPGMVGASVLAGKAALAGGAGLVTIGTTRESSASIGLIHPTLLSKPLLDAEDQIEHSLAEADVVVIGPGLAPNDAALRILEAACVVSKPVILDAGSLHLLKGRALPSMCVITPHPGEAAMLLESSVEEILAAPLEAARRLSLKFKAIAVLKTSRTLIDDGRLTYINSTGNPGMAVGGMGDVLTGILATQLLEEGFTAEACAKAVCLHGHAADVSTKNFGERGLDPLDLIEALKRLWPELEVQ